MVVLSLPEQLAQSKAQGLTPAVAVGAFGLIHAGTIEFLRRARAQCDRLYVVVVPDGGPSAEKVSALLRPEERLRVLASLGEVEAVASADAAGGTSLEALHQAAPEAVWFFSPVENDLDESTLTWLTGLGVALRGVDTSGTCTTAGVLDRIGRGE